MGSCPSKVSPVIDEVTEIKIVLIGKTGSGQSATGNSILQKEVFVSTCSGSSTTRSCGQGQNTYIKNKKIWRVEVVDTPGFFNTGISNEDVNEEIVQCIDLCRPGPHVICFVISLATKLTTEEQLTALHFINLFGKDLMKFLIFVFTYADNLPKNQNFQEVILDAQQWLKDLIKKCDNRYVLINNKTNDQKIKQEQLTTFLTVVEEMTRKNNRGYYTTEMYKKADRQLKKQIEEMKKQEKIKDDARAVTYIREGVYAFGETMVTTAVNATGLPSVVTYLKSWF